MEAAEGKTPVSVITIGRVDSRIIKTQNIRMSCSRSGRTRPDTGVETSVIKYAGAIVKYTRIAITDEPQRRNKVGRRT